MMYERSKRFYCNVTLKHFDIDVFHCIKRLNQGFDGMSQVITNEVKDGYISSDFCPLSFNVPHATVSHRK